MNAPKWSMGQIQSLTVAIHGQHFEKDVSFRCEVPYQNEIGELYKSFNTMMSTVDNLVKDINDLFERQKVWELKALQAQINPHFLYNTLDSVNWMAQQEDKISIRSKSLETGYLTVSAADSRRWSILLVGVIPAALIAVGAVVIIRRKRK